LINHTYNRDEESVINGGTYNLCKELLCTFVENIDFNLIMELTYVVFVNFH